MKNFKTLKIAVLAILMAFSVTLNAAAKGGKTVERGMTMEQVADVYGKPMTTSFDDSSETWTYKKTRGGLLSSYDVLITVEFDSNGRVTRCTESMPEEKPSVEVTQNNPSASIAMRPYYGGGRRMPLSDSDFNILVSKVKGASFDDRKLDLIQVACLGCWLTCRQGASLVAVFAFTDGKMKALRFVAPRLVDLQNTNEIYRLFTFSSDKDKAAEIISKSQR